MNQPIQTFDYVIVGSGPIGSATAYFLTQSLQPTQTVGLLTNEPTESHQPTYRFAGGSVRSFWPDPQMETMTAETTDFLRNLVENGVDLGLIEDHYAILHRGAYVPSVNVTSSKVVDYFLTEAKGRGLVSLQEFQLQTVEQANDSVILTSHDGRSICARRVLVAIGAQLPAVFPEVSLEIRKRQLFVLDTPIPPQREHFPHTVVPFGDGFIFLFLKKVDGHLRLVLGQEDVIEATMAEGPDDYFDQLLTMGVDKIFPFIGKSRVERTLWGFDYDKKHPLFLNPQPGVLAVVCGSAVRSCVWIGRETARRLMEKSK